MTLADLISQSLTYEDAKALALVFGQAPYDALLDYYDIPSNSWVAVTYQRQTETFTAGTSWDNAGDGTFYCQKDATGRFMRYRAADNVMDPWSVLPYPQGAALVGDRLFTADYVDGSTKLTWVYHLRNSGTELFRCMVI